MPSWQSIRFRLSVQYSAVVFGLGGAILGLVYLAIQQWLRNQTMTHYVWSGMTVELANGRTVRLGTLEEMELRAINSVYNEIVLNSVARFTILALLGLFLLSLVVGWIMSGRFLKPINEITRVARDIQAFDLSRRISLEGPDDELTRLANTFDSMLERLDNAFTSQRRFLADTSHDLRTPLTVIRSNVELVSDDDRATKGDWERAGNIIRRNAEKMSEMIDGLLAAARLQTGQAQAVTIDLRDLVEAKAQDSRPIAESRGIVVETEASSAIVQGVEVSLDRALSNLVDNALEAAPPGSVVTLGSGMADGWAWMGTSDEGPGLDLTDGDPVGLGLAIVTQIAEGHGGRLVPMAGENGRGTEMIVWLPTGGGSGKPPDRSPFRGGART